MLINNLQKHKNKYSYNQAKLGKTQNLWKLKSSSYDRNFKSMRKTQRNTQSSVYLQTQSIATPNLSERQFNLENYQRYVIKKLRVGGYQDKNNEKQKGYLQLDKNRNNVFQNQIAKKLKMDEVKTENWPTRQHFSEYLKSQPNNAASKLKVLKTQSFNNKNRLNREKSIINNPRNKQQGKNYEMQQSVYENPRLNNLKNTSMSTSEATITEKQKQLRFLRQLNYNQLFFCTDCFRYIFAIQKHLHYPECKNRLQIDMMSSQERLKIGINLLQTVKQLSEYIKIKNDEIKQMLKRMDGLEYQTSKQYRKFNYLQDKRRYLQISEIETALEIIYNQIVKPCKIKEKCNRKDRQIRKNMTNNPESRNYQN